MTQTEPFAASDGSVGTASATQFDLGTLTRAGLGGKIALGGGVVAMLGALMNWATATASSKELGVQFSASVSGFRAGDGKITFLLAAAVVALLAVQLVKGSRKGLSIAAVVCAALVTLLGLSNWADVKSSLGGIPDGIGISVSVGLGLYLTILAGIAMLAGTVMHLRALAPAQTDAAGA